jgi:hypothetical protein
MPIGKLSAAQFIDAEMPRARTVALDAPSALDRPKNGVATAMTGKNETAAHIETV